MALFQGDGLKAPLMDPSMNLVMRRRMNELWGVGFLIVAATLALTLWSYNVGDPSPFSATNLPALNLLGEPGAIIADTAMRYAGLGSWTFVIFLAVWAVRFLLHIGEQRIWARSLLLLPTFLLATVFASTHAVYDSWQLTGTGLGGTFGDTGARLLLNVIALPDETALTIVSIIVGAVLLIFGAAVLGFTLDEVRAIGRWLTQSLRTSLAMSAGWLRSASVYFVGQSRERLREMTAKPRSETMEPAEPTGSWRTSLPKVGALPNVGKLPGVGSLAGVGSMARRSLPSLSGLASLKDGLNEKLRVPDRQEPDLGDFDTAPDSDDLASTQVAPNLENADRALRAVFNRLTDDGAHLPPEGDVTQESGHQDPGDGLLIAPRGDLEGAESAPAPALEAVRPPIERDRRAVRKSRQAEAERQPSLALDTGPAQVYERPALGLLQKPVAITRSNDSDQALEDNARMLETVLEDYGVRGEIVAVRPGPVVTLYELEPAPGLKASRVVGLSDDIARSMSALAARVSTVPGRSIIGIELPNQQREKVWLRDVFERREYGDARFPLALALGKEISGTPVISNLAKMPHLLIAGTTGSGKSVAINTMILSLLYRLSPKECRLIMIDPKMLELSVYDNIPHLLAPVVTDPKKAIVALKWVVAEMEERYRKMAKIGVRNIDGYNARVRDAVEKDEAFSRTVQTGFDEATGEPIYETEEFEPEEMPYIVVIVDEMADLMMVAGKEIEACIQRLAQMARASGIHLIMATQRPSVDVITGTIKANFPTRISFQVTSKIDSRTILGEQGAEQLLGMGDMLFMEGGGRIQRVHGPFVSDEEVEEVVRHLKAQGVPDYVNAVTEGVDDEAQALVDEKLGLAQAGDTEETLYDKAVAIVARDRKCSTSYIQRKLAIGYNKAARLVEQMEDQGIVTPANGVGKREILVEER